MDKNDIIEYVMNTPHNTNRAVLSGMLNQLTEGGGSSDFSTATVTITNSSGNAFQGAGSSFDDVGNIAYGDFYLEGDSVINLILYKGSSRISLFTSIYKNTVALSGDVEGVEGITDTNKYTAFIVTGDCTITISDESSDDGPIK